MKKFISATFLMTLVFLALSGNMQAQHYSKAISADPIGLAFGLFNATFESQISAQNSFTIFGSYWTFVDWSAYGLGGSYRWYFDLNDGKRPLQGLSAGPFVSVGFWKYSGRAFFNEFGINTSYDGGTSFAIGGEGAYKWVFGGFVVEPILRFSLPISKVTGYSWSSFGLGVNLGYAW